MIELRKIITLQILIIYLIESNQLIVLIRLTNQWDDEFDNIPNFENHCYVYAF